MRQSNRLLVLILVFGTISFGGCSSGGGDSGDGGGGGTISFTVTASAGANGSISPTSVTVTQNGTASFTVTPDTDFQIDTVSGCGGSLQGRTYTTGAITADCTVIASFIINRVVRTLNAVAPLFANAASWNDYAPGSDWSTATDIPCTAATDPACVHGGEHRTVLVTGKTDCTGLTASDDLGAFDWVCDASIGTARMISTGLADGKHLSDIIDFTTEGFRPNAVTVSDSLGVWGSTPASVWWTNPVVVNNSGGALTVADSTVYLVTSDPGAFWLLQADKLTLVVQPGVTLTASSNAAVVIGNIADYLWIEGGIDATGRGNGAILSSVRFSVLNNVAVSNAGPLFGVSLETASKNRLTGVVASNNANFGINLDVASNNNTLSNITASDNGSHGIVLDNASNNTLSGLIASGNTGDGIRLDNASFNLLFDLSANDNAAGVSIFNASSGNTLQAVKVGNNSQDGVGLNNATLNTLTEVTASNNTFSGIRLSGGSSNNRLLVAVASNNNIGVELFAAVNNTFAGLTVNSNSTGVLVRGVSDSNTVTGVTAGNNGNQGVELEQSSNSTLLGVAASNNGFGIILDTASNSTLADLAASNNDTGVFSSGASNNTFTGLLEVGSNSSSDCLVSGGVLPGLSNNCDPNGTSDHTLVTGIDLTSAFAGKVLIDDVQNADDTDGAELSFPADPAAFDWTNFDNGFRGWGVDGSDFPAANHRGRWTIGGGRIWDWSVSLGDNGNAGAAALLNVLALPAGNDTLTHTWSGTPATNDDPGCNALVPGSVWNAAGSVCETTYLRSAVELPDGIGNDNLLCESSETCVYLPNIGAYQGHGDFVSAGAFTDGTLTGITLLKFETNGR